MNLKDALKKAGAPATRDVMVGDVSVRLVAPSVSEMLALGEMEDGAEATFWLLERMVRDETGARVFSDDDEDLRAMGMSAIQIMSDAAAEMLGARALAKN